METERNVKKLEDVKKKNVKKLEELARKIININVSYKDIEKLQIPQIFKINLAKFYQFDNIIRSELCILKSIDENFLKSMITRKQMTFLDDEYYFLQNWNFGTPMFPSGNYQTICYQRWEKENEKICENCYLNFDFNDDFVKIVMYDVIDTEKIISIFQKKENWCNKCSRTTLFSLNCYIFYIKNYDSESDDSESDDDDSYNYDIEEGL